jgi:hypothetical protein
VCLQVLALLVLGNMFQQALLIHEALVTRVTLERLVRLVTPGMGLQV